MVDITNILGGPWSPPTPNDPEPIDVQVRQAMRSSGIEPPEQITIDGQLHRFSTKGRKKDDSGWYVLFPDEPVAGRFGCWRDSIDAIFKADVGREYTAAEQMAITKRMREASDRRKIEQEKKHEITANVVEKIWSEGSPASPDHPYLARKGINPNGARVTGDGRLMVPLFDSEGQLATLQYIDAKGGKLYHSGGKAKECGWMLGDPDKIIYIAEGFSTAATIHEVTGQAVAIAYTVSNIPFTAGMIRDKFGLAQQIVIVADNDQSGVGRNYADQAAALHGARVIVPPIPGDANDYYIAGNDLSTLLNPPASNWLTRAKDFSAEPAPIKWLVKRWLQDQALIMVHGPSGGGKTFVVLDWCLHIASELTEWHGAKVHPGEVVYLAGEGHHGLKSRVAAWRQHFNQDDPALYLSGSGCDLNTPAGYTHAAENIRALPNTPRMIVVDTLHRFLAGDENSAQDAKTMLDACAALMQEFKCSVLLVHHTGVSEEAQHRARGSSAWKGALENEISVVPPKREGDSIQVVQRKAKDAETAPPIYVDLKPVKIAGWTDEDGEPVTSCIIEAGCEPVKVNGDENHDKRKTFEKAWWHTGAETLDEKPYITASGMDDFLTKAAIKKNPVPDLIKAGIIEINGNGWTVENDDWANCLLLTR